MGLFDVAFKVKWDYVHICQVKPKRIQDRFDSAI